MTYELPPNDLKNIWQNQHAIARTMTVQELKDLSKAMKNRMKRGSTAFRVAAAAYLLIEIVGILFGTPRNIWWLRGAELVVFMTVFFLLPYERVIKTERPLSILPRSSTGFEFYQTQLERRLDSLRNDPTNYIVLGVIGLIACLQAIQLPQVGIPIMLVLCIAAVMEYRRRKREVPRLEQELRALRDFQRQKNL